MIGSSLSFFLRTIVLLLSIFSFLRTLPSLTLDICRPDQRDVLLELKNEFKIQKPCEFIILKTKSWSNSSDCCDWEGVKCDTESGKVIELDLSCSCLHGRLENNSSLFRLQHLRDLNLAYNNFSLSPFPTKLDQLMRLEKLNLSESSFIGQVPIEFLQLTKLESLDLSSSSFSLSPNLLSIENPFMFLPSLARNLRNLRTLDLSYVNISSEIPQDFSNMLSLRSLRLEECNLFGEFPRSVFLIPNLKSIKLDNNPNLRGKLPIFSPNNSLQILSLLQTSFSGTIPDSIGNLKHLVSLTLSVNNFTGEIPSSISNLKHLTFFSIVGNNLSGNFPSALLDLTQLRHIDLSFNNFTGNLPLNISHLSHLETFLASDNLFIGAIPASLFNISSLINIFLNDNQFNDIVGIENIAFLPNIQNLFLNNNKFRVISPVDLNIFSSLKHLEGLALSGIPLSTTYSDFPSNILYLYLSGCNITEFPKFIKNQRNLQSLDLSNNNIKGQVPNWLWKLQELVRVDLSKNSLTGFEGPLRALPRNQINVLDLSSNAFQGPLFIPSRVINYLFVSKNNFTGEIPRSLCRLISPTILDLSNNNFHGSIPRCLEDHISSLTDLNLRNNNLNGSLPDMFTHAKELKSIDVSRNQLEGQLPVSLTNCSALEILNVGNNKISDTFPFQLHSLEKLQVLVLRSNKFHGMLHQYNGVWSGFPQLKIIDVSHNEFTGSLPRNYFLNWTGVSSKKETELLEYLGNPRDFGYYTSVILMNKGISMEMERVLTIYTAIDYSGNKIYGEIPESIGALKELHVLNLSRNAFTGHIPSSLGNVTALESLDISQNMISGEIPPRLGDLSSLAWINVSHNQLVGSIPQGTQFQRQNCSSYEGNPGLYGFSLKDVCGDIHVSQGLEEEEEEEEEADMFSWTAVEIGFAPGIVFGLTIGYIVASYKHEWFLKSVSPKQEPMNLLASYANQWFMQSVSCQRAPEHSLASLP